MSTSDRNKYLRYFSVLMLSIMSLILLVNFIAFSTPSLIGDGAEYLGMTISFFNHLTPDFRAEDIEMREEIGQKNGIDFPDTLVNHGYVSSSNGEWYPFHFWGYSLINLPVFIILNKFGFNELRTFQITNSIILLIALWFIALFSKFENEFQKGLFLAFCALSPALLYIKWSSPVACRIVCNL